MSSTGNFFGTDSPLVTLFLETYGGDYTKAPSGENLRKIMMAKTYDANADENAIAPQFMQLIISAADTWRKLDKHSKDSDLTRKRNEIIAKLKELAEGDAAASLDPNADPWKDADNARNSIKAAAKAELAKMTDADKGKLDNVIDNLSEDRFRVIDANKTTTDFPSDMNKNTLPVVLALEQSDITDLLATFGIQLASDDTKNSSLITNNPDWAGPKGKNLVDVVDKIKNGTMEGLSMSAWVNIVDASDKFHNIGSFSNFDKGNWRYNLLHHGAQKLFSAVLPKLPEGATFDGDKVDSLAEVFAEIQGLTIESSKAENETINSLGGKTLKEAIGAATIAKDADIDLDSRFFKALISSVSADNSSKTISDDLFSDKVNDMSTMKIGRDKKGLYFMKTDGNGKEEKNYDFDEALEPDVKGGINECIIKGDKVGLAKCLESKTNFYTKATQELQKMKPETILYMCQKLELVKKSVKLEGTNIVVKVPCPFDEWMQHLKNNPDKAKYVQTLESSNAGRSLQDYIKGVIAYLTLEKRILNETLTDSAYSDKKNNGKVVGKKADGKDRIIPAFVVPKNLKEKMSHSKDIYGSHMIRHQGQGVSFPIYQNAIVGQTGGSTAASFIQTGGGYDKSRSSSVHDQNLKKIITNLQTIGFTVKEADHKQIETYINDLRDTEDKLQKLFTIMNKFESLARSYGYDDLLKSEDDLDIQSLDFSKITNQKDMKAYLYNSIKDVKSVMKQSIKLQNTMDHNIKKHVYAKLLSLNESKSDYETF